MIQTTTHTHYPKINKKLLQTICIYASCIVLVRLITNLFISVSWLPIIADLITGITIAAFYLGSKKIDDLEPFFWPVVLLTQISSIFLWFGMGGVNGPTVVFNIALLVVYIAIDLREQYRIIGAVVVSFTILCIGLEFLNPSWVVPYANATTKILDTALVFITMTFLVTLGAGYMKKRYEDERALSNQKAAELVAAKQSAEESRDLLGTLRELQSSFLLGNEQGQSFDALLKQLLTLTNSQYGFIGEVVYTNGNASLNTFAVMNDKGILKNTNLLEAAHWQSDGRSRFKPLLEEILQSERYILSSEVPHEPANLKAFLGFPILYDNKIIGVVGVANVLGYEDVLVQTLLPFLSAYGAIIKNIRLKRRQKEAEEELKQAKETAEQAVLAKNRLFTNISHEFRTPLSLIVGPVSAILKQPQGALVEKDTRNSLNMVLRNSNKVLQYVDDIMDLAKLHSNKLEVWPQSNHLYSFINGIYNTFKIQTTYRNIDFQFIYDVNRDLIADFDTSKMEKIINNLLSNAFKYTLDGGKITLSVQDTGDGIKVAVTDTGIGIEKGDLPHVFERFYQSEIARKSNAPGSGVGLALAQELAVLQGFEINVTSEFAVGSCFSFEMPKVKSDLRESPVLDLVEGQLENPEIKKEEHSTDSVLVLPEEQNNATSKPRILIVEDNRDMAAFVKLVLGTKYEVDLAENGRIGLNILQEKPRAFDLVITDLMMPEMDGYELLKQIKAHEWGNDLPVIVLTAKSGEASKLKALTIGVDEYLTKPFSVDELTIHVKNLIENSNNRKNWKSKEENEAANPISDHASDHHNTSTKVAKESVLHREKIERAKEVVLENIDETDFSVDDLARALAVSKRQLYRFMQSYTGLTPLKFINEIRLQEARRLLEEGACSTVKEVSYSIGFMSTRHFSKNYSTRFGKKPSEYFR